MKKLKGENWFNAKFPFWITSQSDVYSSQVHGHDFYEFFYVMDGKASHTLGGKTQLLAKGDIVLMNPTKKHGFQKAGENITIINCIFQPSLLKDQRKLLGKVNGLEELLYLRPFYTGVNTVLSLSGKTDLKTGILMQEMLEEFREQPEGYELAIRTKLTDLLVTLARFYEKSPERKSVKPSSLKKGRSLIETLSYLDEHFTEDPVLEDAAKSAGLSREYFSTVFHSITGRTFKQYLNGLRVERAKELLKNTDEKIIEICHTAGFGDVSHFNKMFKKSVGLTPTDFRSQKTEDS